MRLAFLVACLLSSCVVKSLCPEGYEEGDSARALDCQWDFCRRNPEDSRCLDEASNGSSADAASMPDGGDDGGQSGGVDSGSPDGGGERECSSACAMASASWCDTSKGECTACRTDQHCADLVATPACVAGVGCFECSAENDSLCSGTKPFCKAGGNACVECNENADCSNEGAPHCNADNTCGQCVANEDCGRWGKVCSTGQCVQCTPETEVAQCPDRDPKPGDQGPACDPVALTCTGAPRGSVSGCGACASDSECEDGSRCVSMTFSSQPHGQYCVQIAPAGFCPDGAPSKSSATSVLGIEDEYCFPREKLTTCEAVSDFGDACSADADCGAEGLGDGLCKGPDGAKRCTYACSGDSDCAGTKCTGPVGAKYCNPN